MKIETSAVAMDATRTYSSYTEVQSLEVRTTAQQAASLEISKDAKDYVAALKEHLQDNEEQRKEIENDNVAKLLARQIATENKTTVIPEKSPEELKIEILKRILASLRKAGKHGMGDLQKDLKALKQKPVDLTGSLFNNGQGNSLNLGGMSLGQGAGTMWTRTQAVSAFHSEMEATTFSAAGAVKTADGRTIEFNVDVSMTRAFMEKHQSLTQESYILTDPLVINLEGNTASVSDQKFLFDIDADGEKESISSLGQGSGFLALDKNKDGTINDGSELFGTTSGDGFADLKKYDADGNGWIDENDDIFKDLKVWTKNEDGTDRLIDLKEAGVGAIYLGSASTQFSLNNETNQTNAVIQKTGVFLKESGEAGTIQHVDLAI